jgi:hypothetical protein
MPIEFDGVYLGPETYLNGVLLGRHPYGSPRRAGDDT